MECPKCHKNLSDTTTVCPFCHKVLALTCPNCHTLNHSAVCSKCGYIILTKCAKCGKMTPTTKENCNCGLSTVSSIAYNECDTDEYATVIIKFISLPKIKKILKSQELFAKFLVKLKNLIMAQLKDIDAHVIVYGNTYTINFNRELSFATSVNKAIRLSLKVITAFSSLNVNLIDQFGIPLKLTITIMKKTAEELLQNKSITSNVKLMILKSQTQKHLKGMQVIMDQYCQDNTHDYKTDSLYSLDIDGNSVMFYEVLLDNYIIPPNETEELPVDISVAKAKQLSKNELQQNDIYAFNVFDINAKCQFEKCAVQSIPAHLDHSKKIIAIKCAKELCIKTSDIVRQYRIVGMKPLYVVCTEEMSYRPWGFFEKLFKQYYKQSVASGLIDKSFNAGQFEFFKRYIMGEIPAAATPEDARFAFLDQFINFISMLKEHIIIVDGFENIDDTSLQALELYFDKFMKVFTNFIFITDMDTPVHSKIKGLLQTTLYKELTIIPSKLDDILSDLKEDASDFISSFYYERIKENFNGSKLYFDNALQYLADKDIVASFENKLLIKTNRSCMLPKDLPSLIRARLKSYGKMQDASMILAYSVFLGERLDFELLKSLGIKNVEENAQFLESTGFTFTLDNAVFINNYAYVRQIIQASLKKEVQEFLVKTILANLNKYLDNTTIMLLMRIISMQKEEYMLLWKNSQIAIATGDYDAYLKSCLGYLSLIDSIGDNISEESIENNKKEIFQNILMSLYAYSPSKIYSIENILLMDAMQQGDNEKIVKLSNLMLQGALITSNYTEASALLHNILTRMPEPSLIVNGSVNTRFLLLSLVNIEILFNIGDYRSCIELAEELLNVIKPNIIEKIKPAGFSVNLFVTHLMDTFRLAAFAKLLANDNDLEEFCTKIFNSLNDELPDKGSLFAIREYLSGKEFTPSNTENTPPFSKIIYLILQEMSLLNGNFKSFAQNIYQAKLLAADLNQKQLELLCDVLIGHAYAQSGILVKADKILSDVLEQAEASAIFNIVVITRYIIAKHKLNIGDVDAALLIINDTLADIQKRNNEPQVFYAMFERLFIEVAEQQNLPSINLNSEIQRLLQISPNGELERIIRSSDFSEMQQEEFISEDNMDSYEPNANVEPNNDDLAELADSFEDDNDLGTETHK